MGTVQHDVDSIHIGIVVAIQWQHLWPCTSPGVLVLPTDNDKQQNNLPHQ